MIVVALFLTAVSTSAVARQFRAADTQSEDYPTVQAPCYMGRLIAERGGANIERKSFEAATAGIYQKAMRDPAAEEPIERIRKVK
jgi:hypothetical protein